VLASAGSAESVTMAKKKDWTTAELEGLVQKSFAKNEGWVTLFEVSDRTPNPLRRCDVIAFNIWTSSGGCEMWGMEIKSSRADWLKELEDPCKAEAFKKYCHRWWLVSPEHIVKDGELPEGWGHYIPSVRGVKLRERIAAPHLEPQDIPREFLTVLIRNSFDLNNRERQAIAHNEEKRWQAYWESNFEMQLQRKQDQVDRLEERIKIFEAYSGITLAAHRNHEQLKLVGQFFHTARTEPQYIQDMIQRFEATAEELEGRVKHLRGIISDYK